MYEARREIVYIEHIARTAFPPGLGYIFGPQGKLPFGCVVRSRWLVVHATDSSADFPDPSLPRPLLSLDHASSTPPFHLILRSSLVFSVVDFLLLALISALVLFVARRFIAVLTPRVIVILSASVIAVLTAIPGAILTGFSCNISFRLRLLYPLLWLSHNSVRGIFHFVVRSAAPTRRPSNARLLENSKNKFLLVQHRSPVTEDDSRSSLCCVQPGAGSESRRNQA